MTTRASGPDRSLFPSPAAWIATSFTDAQPGFGPS